MATPRILVMAILVMMFALLPIVTETAHAGGFDAAEDFAYYLWQYYGPGE